MDDDIISFDDRDIRWGIMSEVCAFCKHLGMKPGEWVDMDDVKEGFTRYVCKAFPDGIPERIWKGKHKHRRPFKGDNGIRFQEDDNVA